MIAWHGRGANPDRGVRSRAETAWLWVHLWVCFKGWTEFAGESIGSFLRPWCCEPWVRWDRKLCWCIFFWPWQCFSKVVHIKLVRVPWRFPRCSTWWLQVWNFSCGTPGKSSKESYWPQAWTISCRAVFYQYLAILAFSKSSTRPALSTDSFETTLFVRSSTLLSWIDALLLEVAELLRTISAPCHKYFPLPLPQTRLLPLGHALLQLSAFCDDQIVLTQFAV